jgi:hypothetical protein
MPRPLSCECGTCQTCKRRAWAYAWRERNAWYREHSREKTRAWREAQASARGLEREKRKAEAWNRRMDREARTYTIDEWKRKFGQPGGGA